MTLDSLPAQGKVGQQQKIGLLFSLLLLIDILDKKQKQYSPIVLLFGGYRRQVLRRKGRGVVIF